jgi:hypothetical protein
LDHKSEACYYRAYAMLVSGLSSVSPASMIIMPERKRKSKEKEKELISPL